MKHYPWILLTGGLVALAFAPGACGGGSSSGGNGGAGGGASTTTTTTTGTTTSSTGVTTGPSSSSSGGMTTLAVCDAPETAPSNGACFALKQPPACPHPGMDGGTAPDGGPADCQALLPPGTNTCLACVDTACCGEVAACAAIPNCIDCVTGQAADPSVCQDAAVQAAAQALVTCSEGCCPAECFDPGCNPVTNEGCDTAAGEACDLGQTGFTCFPDGNTEAICSECSNANGPFCSPTLHCNEDGNGGSACARYCCDDGDCGANGKCDKSQDLAGDGTIGTCVPK